jgi:acyl transferase domain-containing protein/acyl-CoA synthetase (AMP-forming)/AMP-acid ligase II/acyl carrier protein
MDQSQGKELSQRSSLNSVLRWRGEHQDEHPAFIYLADGENETARLTYGALDRHARSVAAWLQERDLVGKPVVLLYRAGLEFIGGFLGCLYAGAIAVPAYPPHPRRTDPRLQSILHDCAPQAALCARIDQEHLVHTVGSGGIEVLATDALADRSADWRPPSIEPEMLAHLQYTSGSTGNPKGVMVSHGNLLHQCEYAREVSQCTEGSVRVSWQPFFHDMGLIGGFVGPVFCGALTVVMPPAAFLQSPIRWLKAISKYRGAGSMSPNFGYELCVRGTTPAQREGLNLSCWKDAWNGAEPIRADTLDRFCETYEPYGFHRGTYLPCYGMAETTLCTTASRIGRMPVVAALRRDALDRGVGEGCAPHEPRAIRMVSSGISGGDMEVAIVDAHTFERRPDGGVGEIWVSGPSVARGYWKRPDETRTTFDARIAGEQDRPYLRTGDLGFVREGELYVTGRLKDMIIVRGRNLYPQDIEAAAQVSHEALQSDACAAFAMDVGGREELGIAMEVRRSGRSRVDPDEVFEAVRAAVGEQFGVAVHWLGLVQPGRLPKTSSGKIMRYACRQQQAAAELQLLAQWHAKSKGVQSGVEPAAAGLFQRLQALPQSDRHRALVIHLQAEVGRALELKAPPDARAGFERLGMDSMGAVELVNRLQDELGGRVALPATLLFDQPSIEAVAHYVEGALFGEPRQAIMPARTGEQLDDPIAVVGLACRFPGAADADAFWRLLEQGRDAIEMVPPERWDIDAYFDADAGAVGKMNSRYGGFIDDMEGFDAAFFDIAPREATSMDPQHRQLLEVSWLALEDAAIAPAGLEGRPVGVFVGISTNDYEQILSGRGDETTDAFMATGNAHSAAVGRLSFVLGLQGPCVAVDTACSSSLVAVHQAVQSLRQGECEMALAGGVNAVLRPELTVAFCKARLLSPGGRCRTFDASADGYVRSEGCGMVVLKRLNDARRAGDRVLAVIRGSAVNQDGRTSGLTAPSGPSQTRVIASALSVAGVEPASVQYLECHGTATVLGDPIEVQAAHAILGRGRSPDNPLVIGSVKSNVGHLEAAAGIAGLIKVILALEHGRIPRSLYFRTPNPHIPWAAMAVKVATETLPWDSTASGARIAGVSSFGFAGTNAHVVVDGAPREDAPDASREAAGSPNLLAISARTEAGLRELAGRYARRLLSADESDLPDICVTANRGRNHFEHRAVLICPDLEAARRQSAALAHGDAAPGVVAGIAPRERRPRVAFLFPGQGLQYAGMARELYQRVPAFRVSLDRCAEAYDEFGRADGSPPLTTLMFDAGSEQLLQQTRYVQPALYALQVSLAALWRSWGVLPDALLGHSAGEYAAACIAGVFRIEDGLKLIVERARLMQTLPVGGAMLSVTAPMATVDAAIANESSVHVSAYNGLNTVISGPAARLDILAQQFDAQELYYSKLPATTAFHSPSIEPILDAFEASASGIAFGVPTATLISTLTGRPLVQGEIADAAYWRRQARQPVRFAQAIQALFEDVGCDVVLELGPQAELVWLAQMSWRPEHKVLWASSLAKGRDAFAQVSAAAAQLHVNGTTLDFVGMTAGARYGRRLALPTYPFQHERFWPGPMGAERAELRDCYYQVQWRACAPESGAGKTQQSWLILADEPGFAAALAQALRARGQGSIVAPPMDGTGTAAAAIAAIVDEARRPGALGHLVVIADPADDRDTDPDAIWHAQDRGVVRALLAAQALISARSNTQLWLVTRGALAVHDGEAVDPTHAAVWGFGRTFALEHPDRCGGLIDTAAAAGAAGSAEDLAAALLCEDGEKQAALRNGQRWLPRLERYSMPLLPQVDIRAQAAYLVAGGTGAMGLAVARHLAKRGAGQIVLTSRSGADEAARTAIEELNASGCRVEVIRADLSVRHDVERLLDEIERIPGGRPLRGVLFAAGTHEGATIVRQTPESLRKVLAPKICGAWNLHRLCIERARELDLFVLFSSGASLLGSREHANYTASNAFLDSLAHHRRGEGLPALSINWGPWAGLGVAAQMQGGNWEEIGIRPIPPAAAMRIFDRLASAKRAQLTVQPLDLPRWIGLARSGRIPPILLQFLQSLLPAQEMAACTEASVPQRPVRVPGDLAVELMKLGPLDRGPALQVFIRERVGAVLGIPPQQVDPDAGFFDMGMNSIMAVELRGALEARLGRLDELQAAVVFNHPTVRRLSTHLARALFSGEGRRQSAGQGAALALPQEVETIEAARLPEAIDAAACEILGSQAWNLRQIEDRDDAPLRKAYAAIMALRVELEAVRSRASDPVAIVGLGCRYPGADGPDAYWQMLAQGRDEIAEVPPERWDASLYYDSDPDTPGKMNSHRGGFLAGIDAFDPDFFGISHREARSMDPQQRLLLEVSWEALENANLAPRRLREARGGIFIGITAADYAQRVVAGGIENIDAYGGTGNALCAAAGRLAFTLGWQGPALAIDTACSSSLVALHEACSGLRAGECDIALAGGVNLILDPAVSITLAKAHALSPDDRCKAFDASANGYVRSEGCGMLVLKRLADAQRDGDRILALVRATAVNQDGRSSGLTVPNGLAQERVIADALKAAGVAPAAVQYLEAHGTGTPLGDPIEVQAADHVLSQGRDPACPLLIGSVKTNIGHTEAAAGAASVIKLVLALRHEILPKSLHFSDPNPHIPWNQLNVKVVADPVPWPRSEVRRIAGVSSFGFVGTNAHVILEEAPAPLQADAQLPEAVPERGVRMLALSARSAQALAAQSRRYAEWIERSGEVSLDDLCHTANTARDHFEHRAALVFENRQALGLQLAALAQAQDAPGLVRGRGAFRGERRIAFLFTGQGSQSIGMGRELYRIEPVFRECFDRCADEFARIGADAPDLRQLVFEGPSEGMIDQTRYTQPALYALEVSLAALWQAWGVEPAVVLGHSVGEYAAACTAGVFGIEAGLRLIAARGRLMQDLPAGGGMLSVTATSEQVEAALQGRNDLCIGAYNGAETVVSGALAELDALVEVLAARGVRCRRLITSHAFHSARMEPILDQFRAFAAGVPYQAPTRRLISNVSGDVIADDRVLDADYWTNHIRRPVQFERSVRALQALGCDVMLEIGPHPVLTGMGQSCWNSDAAALWTGSLRRGRRDSEQMLAAAGAMYAAGIDFDFAAMEAPWRASLRKVDLPFYAFQRRRFWVDVPESSLATPSQPRLEQCLYGIAWEQRDANARTDAGVQAGTWLILADEGGVATGLRRQLEESGRKCICITAAEYTAGSAQALGQAIAAAAQDESMPLTHVVHLWSLDRVHAEDVGQLWEAQAHGAESALDLVQALVARRWQGRLWLVTRGMQRVLESDVVNAVQRPLWGLGVSIGMEHPQLWGGLVDLPQGAATDPGLLALLEGEDAEDQSALRDGRRWVARLDRRVAPAGSRALPVEAAATYLITGGLGGVGLETAQRLVRRGARHLVLTGRRAPSPSAQEVIAEMERGDCQVRVVLGDIALEADAARLFDEICSSDMQPLKGIVHAAGVDTLARMQDLDRNQLRSTLAPKMAGGWLLNKLTAQRGIELTWFIATSSISAVWGSVGQGAYSAANAFLDALSEERRTHGRAATTVNYGPWSRVGMGAANEQGIAWLRSRGIRTLEPDFALDGMEYAVTGGHSGTVVADLNWTLFRELAEFQRQRPLFEKLGHSKNAEREQVEDAARTQLVERLHTVAPNERAEALKQIVKTELARVLRRRPEEIDDDAGFFDMGMDSLMAVELINHLRERLAGTRFSAALIHAHPSIGQLAVAIAGEIVASSQPSQPSAGNGSVPAGNGSIPELPLSQSQQRGDGVGEAHYQLSDGLRYTYRRYRAGDKKSVIVSFENAFGEQAARALETFFDWKYLQNPLTPQTGPIVDVLECDGRIVGMNGGVCVRFKLADATVPGVWSCDSHVVSEHRKATSWFLDRVHQSGPSVLLGAPNPAMYPFAAATGAIADLDQLVDLRAAIDLRSVLASRGVNPLVAWGGGLLFRSVRTILGLLARIRIPKHLSTAEIPHFDGRFNDLWQAVSRDYPGIMVRDQAFLEWRFDRCPERRYTRYVVERNGKLAGYMVTREQRFDGRCRGIIADFLVHRNDTAALDCLVSRAMRDFAAHGVGAVTFPIASSQREQLRLLRWHGFVLQRHRAHLIARKGPLLESIETIDNWFFTFADGDGDYNENERALDQFRDEPPRPLA